MAVRMAPKEVAFFERVTGDKNILLLQIINMVVFHIVSSKLSASLADTSWWSYVIYTASCFRLEYRPGRIGSLHHSTNKPTASAVGGNRATYHLRYYRSSPSQLRSNWIPCGAEIEFSSKKIEFMKLYRSLHVCCAQTSSGRCIQSSMYQTYILPISMWTWCEYSDMTM